MIKKDSTWKADEIDLLKKVYQSGRLEDITARYFPERSALSVRNKAMRLGLRKGAGLNRKHAINESIFDKWDEASAYLLGVIAADGGVYHSKERSFVRINLKASDREWLEDIALCFGQCPVKIRKVNHKQIGRVYEMATLDINSKKIVERLLEIGIYPKKSLTLRFPSVPNEFVHHFIRGYFDGDGSASFTTSRTTGKPRLRISILGSRDFLESANEAIKMSGYLSGSIKPDRNIYVLRLTNHAMIGRFVKWLYEDATIFLSRKRETCEFLFKERGRIEE